VVAVAVGQMVVLDVAVTVVVPLRSCQLSAYPQVKRA